MRCVAVVRAQSRGNPAAESERSGMRTPILASVYKNVGSRFSHLRLGHDLRRVDSTHRLSALLCLSVTSIAEAGTIVEVQTSFGNFYLEIDEESAPVTGGNFLNYVRSGRYNNTFIHGAIGGSLIRGGGYTYTNCADGPQRIELDDPIPLEDTGLSNLDGTIAALRPSSELNGATSEWFINLGADTTLDTQDGGYAVFGRVWATVSMWFATFPWPILCGWVSFWKLHINYFQSTVNCQQFSRDNLILVLMSVVNEDSLAATASFDAVSELLEVNVDLGADGFIRGTIRGYSFRRADPHQCAARVCGRFAGAGAQHGLLRRQQRPPDTALNRN